MSWIAIVIVAVVLGFILLVVRQFIVAGRRYRPVFAEAHYNEVAGLLAELRRKALDAMDEPQWGGPDPPYDVTSAGLILSYSINRDRDRYTHHLALSLAGHVTPHAVGDRFAFFIADRLGVPFDIVSLGASPATVHHMEFQLDEEQQQIAASRAIEPPSEAELEAILELFLKRRIPCHEIGDLPGF